MGEAGEAGPKVQKRSILAGLSTISCPSEVKRSFDIVCDGRGLGTN